MELLQYRISHHGYSNHNTLRPTQNGHFTEDIFRCIFFNENGCISINISLDFVSKGQINNISALVQIMAWRRPGDKPLSEPVMVSLPTHTCVTRPRFELNSNGCYWWKITARSERQIDGELIIEISWKKRILFYSYSSVPIAPCDSI